MTICLWHARVTLTSGAPAATDANSRQWPSLGYGLIRSSQPAAQHEHESQLVLSGAAAERRGWLTTQTQSGSIRGELACLGHSCDCKRGRRQVEYGLLTDPAGRPVAVEVFAGNTSDPESFQTAITRVRADFGIERLIMVGTGG